MSRTELRTISMALITRKQAMSTLLLWSDTSRGGSEHRSRHETASATIIAADVEVVTSVQSVSRYPDTASGPRNHLDLAFSFWRSPTLSLASASGEREGDIALS
nr:hypothetical protein B0A51_02954 [Rachicladosporium sp. CCFEE 5018]